MSQHLTPPWALPFLATATLWMAPPITVAMNNILDEPKPWEWPLAITASVVIIIVGLREVRKSLRQSQ